MIADVDKENSSGVETTNNIYVTIGNFLFLAPTKSKTVEADFDEIAAIASNMNLSDQVNTITHQTFLIKFNITISIFKLPSPIQTFFPATILAALNSKIFKMLFCFFIFIKYRAIQTHHIGLLEK